MQIEQMDNFRFYLEGTLTGLEKQGFRSVIAECHRVSLEYLRGKKLNYSGSDYIFQLEKNVVYLCEASRHIARETATYVCYGTPQLAASMVPQYVDGLRAGAIAATRAHQAFLQTGCTGCEYHAGHARWSNLKAKRDRGTLAEYIDELEFCLVWYQDLFQVTQNFAVGILQQPSWAAAGPRLPVDEVAHEIEQRVNFRIQNAIGNVTTVPAA